MAATASGTDPMVAMGYKPTTPPRVSATSPEAWTQQANVLSQAVQNYVKAGRPLPEGGVEHLTMRDILPFLPRGDAK